MWYGTCYMHMPMAKGLPRVAACCKLKAHGPRVASRRPMAFPGAPRPASLCRARLCNVEAKSCRRPQVHALTREDPGFDERSPPQHACSDMAARHVVCPVLVTHDVAVAHQWQVHARRHTAAALDVLPVRLAAVALLARAAVQRDSGCPPLLDLGDKLVCNVGAVVVALPGMAQGER